MQNPADLQFAFLAITTHAAPGTFIQTNIIAAPGVVNRLRIWSVGISPNGIGMTLPQQLQGIWVAVVGGVNLWPQSMVGSVLNTIHHNIPGGYRLPANSALAFFYGDSVASQGFRVWANYTVERVAT